MKRNYLLIFFVCICLSRVYGQSADCATADPFCAGGGLTFPNVVNGPTAEPGNYSCLGTQPNPAWFYLQISDPGTLNFQISQTASTGGGIDVDFIAWGPFPAPTCGPANLDSTTEIACSYSTAAVENFTITNAQVGEVYMLLMTNFANASGTITLTQTNLPPGWDPSDPPIPGIGSTDCTIVCPLVVTGGGSPPCPQTILTAVYDNATVPTYQWYQDGVLIPGATSDTYVATVPGDYCVIANSPGCAEDTEACANVPAPAPAPITQQPADLTECAPAPAIFDLTQNDAAFMGLDPFDWSISYHNTLGDAEIGANPIADPVNYSGTDGEIIYISIFGTCISTESFVLNISDCGPVPPPDLVVCDDPSNNGWEIFDMTPQIAIALGTNNPADYTVSFHTTQVGADTDTSPIVNFNAYQNTSNPQPIFIRVEQNSNPTLYGTTTFDLIVNPQPATPNPSDVTVCNGYVLPALGVGQTYHSAAGGAAATQIAVGTNIMATQTIWIYAQSGTTPNCTAEGDFIVTVNQTPPTPSPSDITVCDGYILPALPAGQTYHLAPGGTPAFQIPAGTNITSTQTIWIFAQTGTTPNCSSEGDFTVTVNQTPATPNPSDVTVCDSYTLPALAAGQTYHSASGGAASTLIPVGTNITSTQTIYVFAQTGTSPNCSAEGDFTVTVNQTPTAPDPSDVTVCDGYVLPALPAGQTYHSASGGSAATLIAQGTNITSSQTVWVFAQSGTSPNCSSEGDFTITIAPTPPVPNPLDVTVCDTYTLGPLPAGQTYHSASGGAASTLIPVGSNITSTQTIWVYAQTGTSPNCSSEADFTVTVNPTPVIVDPADVVVCESYELPTLAVGNYFSGPGGTGTAYAAGDVITSSMTMYIFAQTATTPNCLAEENFTIGVFNAPAIIAPQAYNLCDDNNDGFTCFDLHSRDAEITGGNPSLVVTYHETSTDAQNGVNAIVANPYCNIDPSIQTLYVRVTDAAAPLCASFTTLELRVNPVPVPVSPVADFHLCDVNNPGDLTEGFILSSWNAEVAGTMAGVTITYHLSQADAESDTGAIDPNTPYDNISSPQPICARVEYTASGCFAVACFNLVVDPLPVANAPAPMNACAGVIPGVAEFNLTSNDAFISGGIPGITVSYHATLLDAQNEVGALSSPYTNVTNPQTLYVHVEDAASGCFTITTLTLNVGQGPTVFTPDALHECDPNNDGFASFDLTQANNQIMGGGVPPGVSITYHETQTDALNGVNPWPSPYINIDPYNQVIYVRAEFDATGCASFTELALIVHDTPQGTEIAALEVCDDDTDCIGSFDLTQATAGILGSLDPAQHTVTYHVLQTSAETDTSPITNVLAFANTVPCNQTIYVRVEDNTTGCADVIELELIVNPLPVVPFPVLSYSLCDDNAPLGYETFDLTTKYPDIVGSQTGMLVSFHLSAADALSNTAPLPTTYVNQVITVQTLHIRVENQDTGCFVTSTMDIRVEPLPAPVAPSGPITICDDDTDGFATFDLDALVADILQGAPNVTITFHETEQDARDNNEIISNPVAYTNIVPFSQDIWVGAQNDLTGCRNVMMITLVMSPSPIVPILSPIIECDQDANPSDQRTYFNLTQQTPVIIAAQTTPGAYQVEYYESQAEADLGAAPITDADNYFSLSNPQTIWVRVSDPSQDCFGTGSFEINVNSPSPINHPSQLSVCDEDQNPGAIPTAVFDLTVKNAEIIGGPTTGYVIEYFETQADQLAGTNAIPDPSAYTNIANAQTLFVAVTSPAPANCRSFTTLTIRVIPLPSPVSENIPVLEACDDNAPSGTELFDLTVNEDYIRDNDPDVEFEYYTSLADAEAQVNAIADPTAHETATGTIYIRAVRDIEVDLNGNYCGIIVEQQVIVNPLPLIVNSPIVLEACDANLDNQEFFDLNESNADLMSDILGTTQSTADYTVTFHASQADALSGASPLADSYGNTSNPQDVYVRVVNDQTGCVNATGIVTLTVKAGALANTAVIAPMCDDVNDGTNGTDGIMSVDLTALNTQVLGTQAAADYTVSYYTNTTDAAAGTNPITPASAYLTVSDTVYAVVMNNATLCRSASTPIQIIIEPLAAPVVESATGNTICVQYPNNQLISAPTLTVGGIANLADYTYQWFYNGAPVGTGTSLAIQSPDAEGVYTVVATSLSLGCISAPSPDYNVVKSGPAVVVNAPGYIVSNPFADSQTITVDVEGYGDGFYQYSLDNGPLQESPVFTNVSPGAHTITVHDMEGEGEHCEILIIEEIFNVSYPPYFTPNGDGINDTWNIVWPDGDDSPKIYIFDRYGKLLKQIAPNEPGGWDGTYNGAPLPSTDYWFSVEYPDMTSGATKEFKAHFSLKR